MMRHFAKILAGSALLALAALPSSASSQNRYSVSGAALVTHSTGLDNPYTLLRRPDVQAIVTEALAGPIAPARLAALLQGSEVGIENLLETDTLVRSPDGNYRLAVTVLTVADRELINRVSDPLGASLAQAFLAERAAFDRILARYDLPGVDPAVVRMALIGCVLLDWDGLRVTADGRYRQLPVPKANGDRYQMALRESAPQISVRGLYWGSHNASVRADSIWFTSFGDQPAGVQRIGFPDITWIVDGPELDIPAPAPIAALLATALGAKMDEYQAIAGPVMIALRSGPADAAALAAAAGQPPAQVQPVLDLLAALQYVELADGRYRAAVPVFTTARDGAMIAEVRALGQRVMRRWLEGHYEDARRQLSSLASLRAGVDFRTMFTELWHPIFGWANFHLAQDGWLHDPYGPTARFISFVPFVWEGELRLQSFS